MKKARLLVAVLVCSVMMLGIGYAWWNDTLTVSGTVETGKFDVNFIRTEFIPAAYGTYPLVEPEIQDVQDNLIKCRIGNLYPGASSILKFQVKNDGTIPAKFGGAQLTLTGDEGLIPYLLVEGDYTKMDTDGKYTLPAAAFNNITISDLDDELNSSEILKGYELQRDEGVAFEIMFLMNPEAPNATMDQSVDFTLELDWQQFNRP